MKTSLALLASLFFLCASSQEVYVFKLDEIAIHDSTDLTTATHWITERGTTPGYFSAIGGAHFGGASNTANINGYVKHYTTANGQGFSFPVGDGTKLRKLVTSGAIPAGSQFATAWISGNPTVVNDFTAPYSGSHPTSSVGSGIIAVNTAGQWDWLDVLGTGSGITVTVSIPDVSSFATAANLRLVGWDGAQWVNLSSSANASGNTANSTLSGTMRSGISALAIGSVSFVLPVNLLSFTATASSCDAVLDWSVANTSTAKEFTLQASSDGARFTALKNIAAHAYKTFYQARVKQNSNKLFYRLKFLSADGTVGYSHVTSVTTDCGTSALSVFPNPVTGDEPLRLVFRSTYSGIAGVRITTAAGTVVFSQNIALQPGTITGQISTRQLPVGVYQLTLISSEGNQLAPSIQFVKK